MPNGHFQRIHNGGAGGSIHSSAPQIDPIARGLSHIFPIDVRLAFKNAHAMAGQIAREIASHTSVMTRS